MLIALLQRFISWLRHEPAGAGAPFAKARSFAVAEGVIRTLFDEFAAHRQTDRGNEEIGWLLLGKRTDTGIMILGTLPAGTHRDASVVHVRFDSEAQSLASRILRQTDQNIQIVGIVHTHPGSLRQPSEGDYHGDKQWVAGLRDGEGIFAIGTADAGTLRSSAANTKIKDALCFSWYTLSTSDADYRPVAIETQSGPDVGMPVRPVWKSIETWAESVNRMCRLFAAIGVDIIKKDSECGLRVAISLPFRGQRLHLLLSPMGARYYWEDGTDWVAIDPNESCIEGAVYSILAELAKRNAASRLPSDTN